MSLILPNKLHRIASNIQKHNTVDEVEHPIYFAKQDWTIRQDDKKIKYIYHLADIHIRGEDEYYVEYSQIFNKFYEILDKDPNINNSVICICGDILHDGCNSNIRAIFTAYNFLQKLSTYTDLIIIPGNHDVSNNRESLGEIISKLPNVYYLLMTGLYFYNDICFNVISSVFDKKISRIDSDDKMVIGLYHGMLKNTILESNTKVNKFNATLSNKNLKNHHLVLLGDVHKHQYLNSDKTIAYPSSLIQQKYSEDLLDHGYILWDIETKNSTFHRISNDYGYISVNIKGSRVTNIPSIVPKIPRIRAYSNLSNIMTDIIVRKKFPNCVKVDYENIVKLQISNLDSKSDLKELDNQIKIITSICKKNKFDPIKIINIHKDIYFSSPLTNASKYKLIDIMFSNILSYGEGNYIDFLNLDKSVCVWGKSQSGKSSIFDIILWGIYGYSSRSNSPKDLINNINNKKLAVIVQLESDGKIYKISRFMYKDEFDKRSLNMSVKLFVEDGGKFCDISAGSMKDTNNKIYKLFGNFKDIFAINTIYGNNEDLLKGNNLYKLLSQLINTHFELYFNEANKKVKELSEELKIIVDYLNTNNYENESKQLKILEKIEVSMTKLVGRLWDKLKKKYCDGIKNDIIIKYKEIGEVREKINNLKIKIGEIEKRAGEYMIIMDKLTQLNNYLFVVGKHGLPSYFLEIYLDRLEIDSNKILEVMADFKIVIEKKLDEVTKYLGSPKISIYKISNGIKTNVLTVSGSEIFRIVLAIKMSIYHNIKFSGCGHLFLDETFHTLDNDKINNLDKVLDIISDRYNSCFIISHDINVKNKCRNVINVEKVNNFSKLNSDINKDEVLENIEMIIGKFRK